MLFIYGLLAGVIFSIFSGMIIFHLFGKPEHGPDANSIRKIFLSVPFLSLLIFALVCLVIAVTTELLFITEDSDSFKSFLTSPKTWLAFSKELFFAAFIALLIIVVVEVASNDEQAELMEKFKESQEKLVQESIDKAQESVFEGVYKNAVDPAVFEEVVDSIFTADFVREEHHRSIVLESIDDREDIVLMKVKQTYTVKNVTKSAKPSNQRFYLPKTQNEYLGLNQFTRLSIVSEKGDGNKIPISYPFELSESAATRETGETNDPCMVNIPEIETSNSGAETVYTFPTVEVQEDGVIRVELDLQLVKDVSDNEILTFLSPTLRGSFSVHSYIPDLDVKAISLHRGTLTETTDGGDDFKRWTFDKPMLPYQGYVVMWSRALK